MMELLREMLSYPFIVRALTGGLLISLCASLLGVSLVLKRYSMIGDGLSHVSFGALSVAVAFGLPWRYPSPWWPPPRCCSFGSPAMGRSRAMRPLP